MTISHENETYTEMVIHCPKEHCDVLAFFLSEAGSSGVEEREVESSNTLALVAYFEKRPEPATFKKLTAVFNTYSGTSIISTENKININWFKERKDHFKPIFVTEKLVVLPEWEPNIPHKTVIKIKPGMAFGTGNHETTCLALQLIENYCPEHEGGNFIEIGAGSGILSIAATKLGLNCIAACDIQPESREEFDYNFQISGLKKVPAFYVGSTEHINQTANLVIANMTVEELVPLMPEFDRMTKPGGKIIFGGIFHTHRNFFYDKLKVHFNRLNELRKNDWLACVCSKK